ncbi:MAG: hypothetical protein JNL70_19445 [Saprospiraceae bacterium]|nr:hypothetical protein [Saprospiraceae bacterium]
MKSLNIAFILFLTTIFAFSACQKEDVTEEENINVVKMKVGSLSFAWSDTDGDGGAAPKIDTIRLTTSTTSDFSVVFEDGSVSPAKDLTTEIVAESNDHLLVFTPTGANLTFSSLSKDGNGKDFGQTGKIAVGAASTGSLQIILLHQPNKSATDPSKTGTQDRVVTFPVVVK